MSIFRKPASRAWRPAAPWLSLLEAVLLAVLPPLLAVPRALGFEGRTAVIGWLGFAVVLFLYAWLFNRLRPANPPAAALTRRTVTVYGVAVVLALGGVLVACLVDELVWIVVAFVVAVVVMTVASQWFEHALEREVRAKDLDRSPRSQSQSPVQDLRHGPVDPDAPSVMSERASERWAREQREKESGIETREVPRRASGQGQELPEGQAREVRQVYRPTDRKVSQKPNKRKKKRR